MVAHNCYLTMEIWSSTHQFALGEYYDLICKMKSRTRLEGLLLLIPQFNHVYKMLKWNTLNHREHKNNAERQRQWYLSFRPLHQVRFGAAGLRLHPPFSPRKRAAFLLISLPSRVSSRQSKLIASSFHWNTQTHSQINNPNHPILLEQTYSSWVYKSK